MCLPNKWFALFWGGADFNLFCSIILWLQYYDAQDCRDFTDVCFSICGNFVAELFPQDDPEVLPGGRY